MVCALAGKLDYSVAIDTFVSERLICCCSDISCMSLKQLLAQLLLIPCNVIVMRMAT